MTPFPPPPLSLQTPLVIPPSTHPYPLPTPAPPTPPHTPLQPPPLCCPPPCAVVCAHSITALPASESTPPRLCCARARCASQCWPRTTLTRAASPRSGALDRRSTSTMPPISRASPPSQCRSNSSSSRPSCGQCPRPRRALAALVARPLPSSRAHASPRLLRLEREVRSHGRVGGECGVGGGQRSLRQLAVGWYRTSRQRRIASVRSLTAHLRNRTRPTCPCAARCRLVQLRVRSDNCFKEQLILTLGCDRRTRNYLLQFLRV